MTDNTVIVLALVAGIPSTLAAVTSFLNGSQIRRQAAHAKRLADAVDETKTAMIQLEKNTNSKMDKLVSVVAESEFAKGRLAEKADHAPDPLPGVVTRQEEDKGHGGTAS